jgi:hypothetical protein
MASFTAKLFLQHMHQCGTHNRKEHSGKCNFYVFILYWQKRRIWKKTILKIALLIPFKRVIFFFSRSRQSLSYSRTSQHFMGPRNSFNTLKSGNFVTTHDRAECRFVSFTNKFSYDIQADRLAVIRFPRSNHKLKTKLNCVAWIREQTIPTEWQPFTGEVSANFW